MSLTPGQIAALQKIQEIWPQRNAVIIGATALGFYMDMPWRQTVDVDLVVAIDTGDLETLARQHGWQQRANRDHEFLAPGGSRLDLLPACPDLLAQGFITWPSGHTMNLAGIDLAFAHSEEHHVADGLLVRVAPPPVVTILKMASYCDRPADRERDLADIAHLLDFYVDDDSERRWAEAAGMLFELASPYLLGLDVGRLTIDVHRALVHRFLSLVEDTATTKHQIMERRGPATWHAEEHPLDRRLTAFRRGLDAAKPQPT